MNLLHFLFILAFFENTFIFSKKFNIPYKKDFSSFQQFTNSYEKIYNSNTQLEKGYTNFKKNIDFINSHNTNSSSSFSLRLNHFADEDPINLKKNLFSFEIEKQHDELVLNNKNCDIQTTMNLYNKIPDNIDYRQKNAVTPVKNQGKCGSCWAFSTVGALESKYALNTGKLKTFSEQKLVDCSDSNFGCNGGLMHKAFDDILWSNGLPLEKDYPYIGSEGKCQSNIPEFKDLNLLGYQYVLSHSSTSLKNALQHNPVCIALAGDPMKFLFYGEGIFDDDDCSKSNNHAVLLVGYNTTNDVPYWIVKNSWGENWGENGYIRIKMQDGEGILGMNQYGLYPY